MCEVSETLQQFLDYLRYELNRAPLTVEAYQRDISQFSLWLSPDNPHKIDYKSITVNDVRAWMAGLAKSGETPRTLRRKIISLRSLFKWMMKTGRLKTSPIRDLPLPKISKPLPELIKPNEVEEALEKENDILRSLIVEMLYTLGIRRAELVGLNDSDISFSKAEIKVTGKRSKQRVIPLPLNLLDKIKAWQNKRDREEVKPENESPLFIIKGKRITPDQVYKIVTETLATATARKKSPHTLRHSFASGMLNGGAELDSVREFLGHSSLATTQIYTHISLSEIKKAYSSAHPRSGNKK